MSELSTAASSGFPMRRESEDMSPESWSGLVGGLLEFLGEEAAEPEHANDDVTATVLDILRTLYVKRPLKNAAALIAWARKAGFPSTLPAEEMHATLAYSKATVAWGDVPAGPGTITAKGGERTVEPLGADGAIVLRFESAAMTERWVAIRDVGAVWSYPEFKPHVTITYDAGDVDLTKVEPYDGPLEFGPEVFAEVKDGWQNDAKAALVGDEAVDEFPEDPAALDAFNESDHPRDGGKFSSGGGGGRSSEHDQGKRSGESWAQHGERIREGTVHKEPAQKQEASASTSHERKLGALSKGTDHFDKKAAEAKKSGDKDGAKKYGDAAEAYRSAYMKLSKGADEALVATDSALTLALDKDSVRTMDRDGRMHVAETNICKACVSPYRGDEIPGWDEDTHTHALGLDPDKIYKLLRDPEELEKATPTLNGVQLLKKHNPVDAKDHKPYDTVGSVGTTAKYEHPYVRNGLTVWSGDDIGGIESKDKHELSPGYHYRPDMTPGKYDGEPYDGVMRDIHFNHVALVENGRQGPDVVVGDSAGELMWAIIENALLAA